MAWASSTSRRGPTGTRVALKVLRPHVVGDLEARERLAREVSSLRRITSPRIAEIIDADPHGEVPYVVTRYVPGSRSTTTWPRRAWSRAPTCCTSPTASPRPSLAVHSVGVLHRDVKPTNVLMEGRSPVLIDFGLARVAEDPRLTQTGWLLGTPGYLAPEILYGDDPRPASDVHAWAATAVFAATGRPPYGKGPAMAIMDRVRRGEHDLSGIADPLRHCCARLSPDPLERPSVHELRAPSPSCASSAPAAPGRRRPSCGRCRSPRGPRRASEDGAPPAHARFPDGAGRPRAHAGHPLPDQARRRSNPVDPELPGPAQPPPASRASLEPGRTPSRAQRRLQIAGLGALAAATVAYAPYPGTALVASSSCCCAPPRSPGSGTARRRMVRGRARWYDVPTTTLSTPGYLVLALFGALALVAWPPSAARGVLARLPVRPAAPPAGGGRPRVRRRAVVGAGVRPGARDDPGPGRPDRRPSSAAGSWW